MHYNNYLFNILNNDVETTKSKQNQLIANLLPLLV